jgi:hypothetical protein
MWSDDSALRQVLHELQAKAGRVIVRAHQVVIGHSAEAVMRCGRHVDPVRPLTSLEFDVALLLALGHGRQERGQAIARRVLATERDEQEATPIWPRESKVRGSASLNHLNDEE